MPSRLVEIYKQEKKSGGSLGTALGKSLGEKIDPRRIIDPNGIIATLFPSLKAYRATPEKNIKAPKITKTPELPESPTSSKQSLDLSDISATMRLVAKNTLSIPMMARDVNLIKTNIFKVTRALGQKPETSKTDIFWQNAKDRETMLESTLKSMKKSSGFVGASPAKQTRDGQSKDKALYVETSFSFTDMLSKAFMPSGAGAKTTGPAKPAAAGGVLGKLKSLLPFVFQAALPVLGIAGIAGLLYFLIKKDSGEQKTVEEMQESGGWTPEQGGVAGTQAAPATDEELKRARENMRNSSDPAIRAAAAELDRRDALKAMPNESDAESRRLGLTVAPIKNQSEAESRRLGLTPAPVTPTIPESNQVESPKIQQTTRKPIKMTVEEEVPSNVLRDSSGNPVRAGSGGFVTSGTDVSGTTSPTKVESAPIPSASGLPIDYKSYAQKIGEKESSGNYKAVNTLGYLGKYQFGAMALQDMGLVKKGTSLRGLDDPENWNIEGGKQAFLNDPTLQEETMVRYTKQNYNTLQRIGVINKDSSPQEVAGYLAASHLLGPGGARDLSRGKVSSDAYGTSSASYFNVGSATQGIQSSVALASASPTSGPSVSSASSSVVDNQRQMMTASVGGGTVVNNTQVTNMAQVGSKGKSASAYNVDLINTLISSVT